MWWEQQLVFWIDLKQGTIKRARVPGRKFRIRYTVKCKPPLSGPLLSGHLSNPRNSLPMLAINLSPLLSGRGLLFRLPNWLIILYFTSLKRSPSCIIMRYFDAMKSKSCPASLTAHETQHKTCNQRKNAIAWANRSVWVHHNLLQLLPYYMLYCRTTLLSVHLY